MRKLLTYRQLRDLGVPYSRQWLKILELENRFPKHVRVSKQRIAWVDQEIQAWVDERIEERK
jgi:prophage regulatory protein